MNRPIVYVALQQFCESDEGPRHLLLDTGCEVRQNTLGRRLRNEEMAEALRDADAVIAGVERYDAPLFEVLPRLRCISRCGAGTDEIDVQAADHHGIAVYTTTAEVVEPVAQLTVGVIFAFARNLPLHINDFRGGVWKKRAGVLLSEWTIGLVGFGRIGRAVEQALRPFGPRVLVADPALGPGDVPEAVELCDLPSLLASADLISLHASRRPEEGVLIGRKELAAMKPGSRLINTARGHLVDEEALVDALVSGHLAGAGLDVFAHEPYAGPLAKLPQVLCTPHVATLTRASRAAMEWRCARNVADWCVAAATPRAGSGGMPALRR